MTLQCKNPPPQKPLGFSEFDAEFWLARRCSELLAAVFTGDTVKELRKARIRRAILAGGLEHVVAGKGPSGKTETLSELFRRVYEEELESGAK